MRHRQIGLLAFAMLPMAALVAVYLSADYSQTIKTAKDGVFSAAKLAAATESRIFDETRSLLGTLALGPAVTPRGGEACSAFLRQANNANPLYNTIGVVDAEGTINCHTSLKTRQGLTDLDLVERMKMPGAPKFLVGNFVIGRVSGKPTVILARSFPSEDGGFTGAVFASLSLDRLTHEVERVSDGGSRSVMLIEPGTDRVILHYPPLRGVPFGTAFPGDPLMVAMHAAGNSGTAEVRGIDGAERVYGFAPVPSAGNIVLAVGEDRETLIAPVRDRLSLSILGFLTFLLAAASAVWWLSDRTQLRPMQRLMEMAGRIGIGKADVTTNLESWQAPELRNLEHVLGLMAVRLSNGRKAEAIVAESEARFRLLAENTADLITCSDSDGRRVYVSPASRDLLGYEPADLVGKQPRDLAHPDDVPTVDIMMAEVAAGRPASGVQYRVAHRNGGYRWAEVAAKPLDDGAGTVFVMRDITSRKMMENELAEANRQLELLASTDGLTGLANRRALDKQLELEFARATRGRTDLSFLLIDVDSFKAFNDTYGHQAGDDCLRQLAAALKGSLRRPGDLTARYGGEELAAILPATNAYGAFERAEVVRRAVHDLAIPHSGSSHGVVTISVGVATLDGGADLIDVAGLIHTADTALYQAKAKGRNKVVAGTAALSFSTEARSKIN